jgi:hypothetical protein
MGLPSTKRWIVIIDRSPRGPLSEEEVKTLLTENIVRMNSIACFAPETGGEEKTEWKFLWQFPEFERRKPLTEEQLKTAPYNKRKPINPVLAMSALESKVREIDPETVPDELKNVSMSDLVPTTKKAQRPMGTEADFQEAKIASGRSGPDIQIATKVWFAAAGILFIGGGLFLKTLFSNTPLLNTPSEPERPREVRAPQARPASRSTGSTGSTSLLNSAPKKREEVQIDPDDPFLKAAKLKEEADKNRDAGRIPEDEGEEEATEENGEAALEKALKNKEETRDTASAPDEAPDSESASASKEKSKKSDSDGQENDGSSEPEPEE